MKAIHRLILVLLTESSLLAAQTIPLGIETVEFDRETNKVTVAYVGPAPGARTELQDSGPILLCVLNRVLRAKYRYSFELPDGVVVHRDDLALLNRAVWLLDSGAAGPLRRAVAEYFKAPNSLAGRELFDALATAVQGGLLNRAVIKATRAVDLPESEALRKKLRRVKAKLAALAPEGDEQGLEDDEKRLVQRLKLEQTGLEDKLARAKPQLRHERALKSPVNEPICAKEETGSRTVLSNKNLTELLASVKSALDGLFPPQAQELADNH